MKPVALVSMTAALITVGLVAVPWGTQQHDAPAPRVAVVAELFTSEGCSSCPAADDLLRRIQDEQPIAEAEVVVLSEHVDYWNRLGWTDPFSSPSFTHRQSDYASDVFRSDRIYTPQLVVDGRLQAVGSDAREVQRLIAEAARERKATVVVRTREDGGRLGEVDVEVRVEAMPADMRGPTDVALIVAEDDLASDVNRGENANRHLRHTGVVRRFERVGEVAAERLPATFRQTVRIESSWKASDLRAIGLLQNRRTHRIVGAATTPLIPD
jgi:hypothetical protein